MPCHASSHHFLEGRSVLLLYWSFPCCSSSSCFSPQHLMSKPAKEEDQQPVQERGHWSKKVRRPSFQGKPNRVALKCAVLYEELPTLVGDYSTIKNMKIVVSIVVYKFYRLPKKRSVNVSLRTLRRGTMEMLQGPRPLTSNRRKIINDDVMEGQNVLYLKPRPMNFLKMTISGMILCIVLYSTSRAFP